MASLASRGGLLLGLGLSVALTAPATALRQQGRNLDKTGAKPMPLHRPLTVFTPQDAFRHLDRGNRVMLQTTRPVRGRGHQPQPLRRPAGAGRHVAAVVRSISYKRSAAELFATRHSDLLVFASPGPCIRSAEVSALEDAVRDHRLSLLVILVHPLDPALRPPQGHPTKTRQTLWQHVQAAHKLAAAARISLAEAHGLMQADVVWRLSPYLRRQRQLQQFRIAVGIVKPQIGAMHWATRWHQVPPLVTSSPGR